MERTWPGAVDGALMPIDASIYGQQVQPKINTPFENLSQMLQVRQQQQSVQSNQALEQERRAKIAADQRAQAEADAYYKVLAGPGTTDERLEAIRTNPLTAKFYAPTLKSKQEADKTAEETRKVIADAAKAHAEAAAAVQAHQAGQAQKVIAADYNPQLFTAVARHELELFPELQSEIAPALAQVQAAPPDQQQALVKQIMQGWGHGTPTSSNAMTNAAQQAAQEPGQIAQSAVAQQVAAGTVGGITPQQQATNKIAATNAATSQGQLGVAQARESRENVAAHTTGDISSDVRTTLSGQKYLDLGDYQTPKERSAAAAAAKAAGVMPVSKEVGASLAAADTAKQNINAMWSKIESKLPKTPDGRLVAGPGNKLKQYFQTDDDLAAFNSWRAGAIQAVQALVERGMGFRLNKSEIDMIMQNDMPQVTDTVGTAKARVQNMLTLLSNKEKTALTRDRSELSGAPEQREIPGIPGGIAELRNGKWIRIK